MKGIMKSHRYMVILAIIGALLLPAEAMAVPIGVTTQNVRVGLPRAQAHHDIAQAAQNSSVVFTQEMGLRRARNFAPQGWGVAHFAGLRQGDCATYWDRDIWVKQRAYTTLLTNAPFRAGTRYALTTILHMRNTHTTVAFVCVHMITKSVWPSRRPVYARGINRLRTMISHIQWPVVVGGDWNRNWPQRVAIPGLHTTRPPVATGPRGGRIDYMWWRGVKYAAKRVIHRTFSDHNGFRVHLNTQ